MSVLAESIRLAPVRRILIVDDDRDFAESTADLLELEGYDVILAHDVITARGVTANLTVHTALVDVRLGNQSGIHLIRELKQQHPSIVCVVMTAYASAETAIEALQIGAYDYLRKPFHPGDLLATLKRVFERLDLETEKSHTEDALRESERRFRDLIEGSVQGVVIHRDWIPLYVNQAYANMLGYTSRDEILGMASLEEHLAPHERERLRGYEESRMVGRATPAQYEFDALRQDGSTIALQSVVRVLNWEGRAATQSTVIDVTERKRALRAMRRYEQIISSTADLMAFVDKGYTYQAVNDAYLRAYELGRNEIVGSSMAGLHGQDAFEGLMREAVTKCLNGEEAHYQDWFEFPALGRRFMDVAYYPYREEDDSDAGVVVSWRDLTETHTLSEQLTYQATHDALTGLANRREFEQRLRRLMDTARVESTEHALCYLDLDQFKVINDICGHVAGDELLRQLGMLLPEQVRKGDTLARLGGDEFGVLMEGCTLMQATRVANALLDSVAGFQFHWEDKTFNLGVSIGVVPINETSESITAVLSTADAACYAAKDEGRNRIHVFKEDDTKLAIRQGEMQWVSRIQRALDEDRFELHAQTIARVEDREDSPLHYEVLLRMEDEWGEVVLPGAFFSAAERYNLSAKLDRWVVRSTFDWLCRNEDHLRRLFLCSVNLSGHSFGDEELLELIVHRFEEGVVPPRKICFEITETAAIANLSSATRFIKLLKGWGCQFALDDFGSGLSSFAYLKNLPVDYLKIDGIFVKDIVDDAIDFAMVKSINDIGHVMGKQTVAEFVESEAVFAKLREIGVDYAQGYAIGVPRRLRELI